MKLDETLALIPEAVSLVFVKLGGSLITDKRREETPRLEVIRRLAAELAAARAADPHLWLVVGHGSGSFGHVVGSRYRTRDGVHSSQEWYGFAATADAAARLNRIVTAQLLAAGMPAWSIQPGVSLRCVDGRVVEGPLDTVRLALAGGLTPVLHGDVALDSVRGGTIVSTEEIFEWLALYLPPRRMVLAGEVEGVFSADPQVDPSARLIPIITAANLAVVQRGLGGSHGIDVTGGMAAKVAQAMAMAQRQPGLRIVLCSGLTPGHLQRAVLEPCPQLGTTLFA